MRLNNRLISVLVFIMMSSCSKEGAYQPLEPANTPSKIATQQSTPMVIETNIDTVNQILTTPITANVTYSSTPIITNIYVPSKPSPTLFTPPTPVPPDYWMTLPIIPEVSQNAREIYQQGIEIGRNPHAFSKIGDCQSITTYFLGSFDDPSYYNLGEYTSLQETIEWFAGSFSRESLAVKGGFNAAAVLSPLRADPAQCRSDENPIMCEFRINNPSITIISLEEWWAGHPENYEKYLRQIIEYSIQQGVLPIVATKADNLEGNHLINQTIAKLAHEYDIPLWNFWLAVQPLPNHGLIAKDSTGAVDMFHLTVRNNFYFFDNRIARKSGWSVRNLSALQVLDSVHRSLTLEP